MFFGDFSGKKKPFKILKIRSFETKEILRLKLNEVNFIISDLPPYII